MARIVYNPQCYAYPLHNFVYLYVLSIFCNVLCYSFTLWFSKASKNKFWRQLDLLTSVFNWQDNLTAGHTTCCEKAHLYCNLNSSIYFHIHQYLLKPFSSQHYEAPGGVSSGASFSKTVLVWSPVFKTQLSMCSLPAWLFTDTSWWKSTTVTAREQTKGVIQTPT